MLCWKQLAVILSCANMSDLESLVQNYFLALEVHEDEFTGYIDGSGEFSRFTDDLRSIGFMFVIRTTSSGSSFLFNHTRKGAKTPIPFFGPLFRITKNLSFECRFGKSRNHAPKHSQNVLKEPRKERNCSPSKKIGCKAVMHVSELTIYPDFTISEYNSHGSVKQTEVRRQLIETISASKQSPPCPGVRPPTTVTRYTIAISREDVHSHSLAVATQACQPLHPKLAAEIKLLASDQDVTVSHVRLHLEAVVQRMIEETGCVPPNRQNRRFYPTNKVIYQHLCDDSTARKKTAGDRILLEKYVELRSFRSADLDDWGGDAGDRTLAEPGGTDEESFAEGRRSLTVCEATDVSKTSCAVTDPVQLVTVKIVSPNLSSMKSNMGIVPKLKVLSDEADVLSLRSEIWTLLERSRERVHVTDDVQALKTAKTHLLAASLALEAAAERKTVSVFLRSAGVRKVKPVVVRNSFAFEEAAAEFGSILGV